MKLGTITLFVLLSVAPVEADFTVSKNADGTYTVMVPATDVPVIANAGARQIIGPGESGEAKILREVLNGWLRGETQDYLRQLRTTALNELQKLEAQLTRARLDAIILGTANPLPTDLERQTIMDAVKRARGEQ